MRYLQHDLKLKYYFISPENSNELTKIAQLNPAPNAAYNEVVANKNYYLGTLT